MAEPLKGGGGKGPANKEKITFFGTFLKICHLEIKIILL